MKIVNVGVVHAAPKEDRGVRPDRSRVPGRQSAAGCSPTSGLHELERLRHDSSRVVTPRPARAAASAAQTAKQT